ncbi:MAG: ThuA domain-containing protein [Bacteroidales bacterium]|jgi:type 1 glutamine amidotransferase|nr:ThuA domain-containing protein [Bacteroidales bacterium]
MLSRRSFLFKSAAATVAAMAAPVLSGSIDGPAQVSPLKGKKVLFVWGGWMGHEPDKCRDIFVPWMQKEGAEVTVSDKLDAYTEYNLKEDFDLIVQSWTMGTITNPQEKALLDAVKSGVGIAGWHGGLGDSFRNNTEYQFMVGGQWVAHPGGVIDYRVNITDQEDPVTKGIVDFDMHSEQYFVHVDPNVKVLAVTKFDDSNAGWIGGNIVPVVWKKYYGNGRVFYSSLGHVAADFNVPQALEIQKRGINWASLSRYEPHETWIMPVYGKQVPAV